MIPTQNFVIAGIAIVISLGITSRVALAPIRNQLRKTAWRGRISDAFGLTFQTAVVAALLTAFLDRNATKLFIFAMIASNLATIAVWWDSIRLVTRAGLVSNTFRSVFIWIVRPAIVGTGVCIGLVATEFILSLYLAIFTLPHFSAMIDCLRRSVPDIMLRLALLTALALFVLVLRFVVRVIANREASDGE